MPLIENRDARAALTHLTKVLARVAKLDARVVILERFHLTHAFRTGASLREFRTLETAMLRDFHPLLVLLTVSENALPERILATTALRGASWAKGKQGSDAERVSYYSHQQRRLIQLARCSRLPLLVLDTTGREWAGYASGVLRWLDSLGSEEACSPHQEAGRESADGPPRQCC